jgi:hypothetical protein
MTKLSPSSESLLTLLDCVPRDASVALLTINDICELIAAAHAAGKVSDGEMLALIERCQERALRARQCCARRALAAARAELQGKSRVAWRRWLGPASFANGIAALKLDPHKRADDIADDGLGGRRKRHDVMDQLRIASRKGRSTGGLLIVSFAFRTAVAEPPGLHLEPARKYEDPLMCRNCFTIEPFAGSVDGDSHATRLRVICPRKCGGSNRLTGGK